MKNRWDGSIQSFNTPIYSNTGIPRDDFGLYRCMILSVLYVDDDNNISKKAQNPEVLYDCVILGGFSQGQTISNCRLAQYLNYSERILTPTSKDISKVKLSQHDGDLVWVQFAQGHDAYPIIIGVAKGISDKSGATKDDGIRLLETFNGVTTNINKNGELITSMTSGSVQKSRFVLGDSTLIKEEWLKSQKLVKTFKSGLKITEDGENDKVEIVTNGGVTTSIDGKNNKVSIKAGSTEVLIDGASGKISLKGEMIDLGSSVSDFVTQFTQLVTAFSSHTHSYTDDGSPAITGVPIAPLLSSVGSQTVKVQS